MVATPNPSTPNAAQITIPIDAPNSTKLEIGGFIYAGSGCPAKSAAFAAGESAIIIAYDSFTIASGPGFLATDQLKACTLVITLKYPSGFQVSLVRGEYYGSAKIVKGASGILNSTYSFSLGGRTQPLQVRWFPTLMPNDLLIYLLSSSKVSIKH